VEFYPKTGAIRTAKNVTAGNTTGTSGNNTVISHQKTVTTRPLDVKLISPQGIPIGIDFHTRARQSLFFGGFQSGLTLHSLLTPPWNWVEPASSPYAQELELETVAASLPPTSARPLCVFADFQYNAKVGRRFGNAPTRLSAVKSLAGNPWVVWGDGRKKRSQIWREKGSRCAFELSMPGAGMDCHRTWESFLLGSIVLMPTGLPPSFTSLFHGLPVVFVDTLSWRSINEENLRLWRDQFGNASNDPTVRERVTAAYWLRKIDESVRIRAAGAANGSMPNSSHATATVLPQYY